MKKIILAGVSLTLGIVVFSSFISGVYTAGAGDCTGANGSTGSCSKSGCHFSSVQSDLNVSIIVTEASNGNIVTGSYIPNNHYVITLKGTHSAGGGGSFNAYGLQFTTGKANDGQFTLVGNSLKSVVIPPYEYIEHKAPLTPIGPAGTYYETYFLWQAPPPGAGNITFYCTMLAGNGDHFASGDIDKNTSIIFTEGTTSVADLKDIVSVDVYPNPAVNEINVRMEVKNPGDYIANIYNLSGQKVMTEQFLLSSGAFTKPFAISHLAEGMYIIELKKGMGYKHIPFIKQ